VCVCVEERWSLFGCWPCRGSNSTVLEVRVRLPRLTYQAGRRRDAQSLAVLWRGPRFGQEWLHGKRLLLVTVFMRGRAQSFADLRDSRLNDVFN